MRIRIKNRKKAEANARRKVAKKWARIGLGVGYKRAAIREAAHNVEELIKEEAFDGFLLLLSEGNRNKSMSFQKRILRRIIEKRQAQAVHRYLGHGDDRLPDYLSLACGKHSMRKLYGFHNI